MTSDVNPKYYNTYNQMSDPDILNLMNDTIAILQNHHHEDLAAGLMAFVDRYKGISEDLDNLLTKEYMRDDYRTKG
jgi:hypothetical protein